MRLFIGIFPPKEVLDDLRDALRRFEKHKRNLKSAPVDQMHITLKYIGSNVSEYSYDVIRKNLMNNQKFLDNPIEVNFQKLQFGFRFDKVPRVLMAQIDNSDSLLDAVNFYHSEIKELKLKDTIRQKGRFSDDFHVTLARLKDTAAKSTAKNIKDFTDKLNGIEIKPFKKNEAYLVESIIRPGKPVVYKKLERLVVSKDLVE
ncbi:RNA 2',3'-cyclic phosphodiesterase [Candidatus Dojkabacteria bacterium]|uniref:RNA 2',3'-cyclic phosphodiesterase n=1 Tax=Candidatus Dojkabacteria bacterium TaxID=2099670 RepID=A0A955I7W2_9BACT|nr:RNA 2',3'-cyclic phosphodiesterase [Candidatus Dojkabacteria bacterium]